MFKQQLNELQIHQLEHDERFPKEITNLNIHQRLNHMCLHFAKYNGRIIESIDSDICDTSIIDMAIICLTTANILNLRLADKFETLEVDLFRLGEVLNQHNGADELYIIKTLSIAIGGFAKACESLDHLEALDYRGILVKSVVDIFSVILIIAYTKYNDLALSIPYRLNSVQNRSILRNKLKTHKERLLDYGYASGSYMGKCGCCKVEIVDVDKRATCCLKCAEKMLEADERSN